MMQGSTSLGSMTIHPRRSCFVPFVLVMGVYHFALYLDLSYAGQPRQHLRQSHMTNHSNSAQHTTGNLSQNGINTTQSPSPEKESPESDPELVWLMSFPNSGTSYTMANTRKMSNRTVASNYMHEVPDSYPTVHVRLPNQKGSGDDAQTPVLTHPHLQLPDKYLLTKTHCEGRAEDTFSFLKGCAKIVRTRVEQKPAEGDEGSNQTADNVGNGTIAEKTVGVMRNTEEYYYDPRPIHKVVHLIRSPYDNIVARKHLAARQATKLGRFTAEQEVRYTAYTPQAFQEYCSEIFAVSPTNGRLLDVAEKELDAQEVENFRALTQRIPCVGDVLQWINWHNKAVDFILGANLRSFSLHYEDYDRDYNSTVTRLFDFLELEVVLEAIPFEAGKTYTDHYTAQQLDDIRVLVKRLASTEMWQLVKRYFE